MKKIICLVALLVFEGAIQTSYAATIQPSELPGLLVWLNGDNVDGAGNANLTDGQDLAFGVTNQDRWVNTGSASDFLTASQASRAPSYHANVINGHDVVRFDGGDDLILSTTLLNSLSEDATFFWVVDGNNSSNGTIISTRNVSNSGWTVRQVDADTIAAFDTSNAFTGNLDTSETGFYIGEHVRGSGSGSLFEISANGGTPNSVTRTGFNTASGGTSIGRDRRGVEGLVGDIAELIIYERVLSDKEINAVGFYLEDKYGIDSAYLPTPEPSTALLAMVGFIGCVACRRRRRRE